MTQPARIPDTAAGIEIPTGARIPLGAPTEWLAAARVAGWQCQCVTPGKGRAKSCCGRSHFDEQDHRCQHSGAGDCAMRLILATDAAGVLRLMCEPCAAGHAATLVRQQAAKPAPDPGGAVQQHRARVPDHPFAQRLEFQSAVPSITLLHREGASLHLDVSDFAIRSSQVAGTFSQHGIRSAEPG